MEIPNPLPQLRHLFSELKRRRVFRAVAAYAIVAWVVIQVVSITFEALFLPPWTQTLVVFLAVLGFPVVTAVSWAFEISLEGIRKTPVDEGSTAVAPVARAFLVVLVVAVTAGSGWIGWNTWLEPRIDEGSEAVPGDEESLELNPARVGVLYFDDHSPEGSLGHFARGLTEGVIHQLAQVEALDVISRHGVKPYRGGNVTLDSVARALGAGSLVEGSVQRAGDQLDVTVQLVDGETQTHLMSTAFRRPVGELFALQDSLVATITRRLRQRLGREIRLTAHRSETNSVEAWNRVQRARELRDDAERLREAGSRETALRISREADSLLSEAESLDPDWNRPTVLRARLAASPVDNYAEEWTDTDRRRVRTGLEHADRAVEQDPDDPRARVVRGQLRYWLYRHTDEAGRATELLRSAEEDLRKAVDRDPDSARGWYGLSEIHYIEGEPREALYAARRAREADAFLTASADIYAALFNAASNLPEYDRAARWCRRGQQEYPDHTEFWACELILLASEGGLEPDPARAWELLEQIRERASPENRAYFTAGARHQVAAVLARAGLADSARSVLGRAREARSGPQVTYEEAHTLLVLGEKERALDRLSAFLEARPQLARRLADDPWFAPLRDHPRFRELVGGGR